jgi:hypothetical protein
MSWGRVIHGGKTTGTRATTGLGARCTTTENTSWSTAGESTARPRRRAIVTAVWMARAVRAAMDSGVICSSHFSRFHLGGTRREDRVRRGVDAPSPMALNTVFNTVLNRAFGEV